MDGSAAQAWNNPGVWVPFDPVEHAGDYRTRIGKTAGSLVTVWNDGGHADGDRGHFFRFKVDATMKPPKQP